MNPSKKLFDKSSDNLLQQLKKSELRLKPAIDNVPNELIQIVFEFLDIVDLLNCRLVSKNFKFICDNVKIKELIIDNDVDLPTGKSSIDNRWFFTNDNLNKRNMIRSFDLPRRIFEISFELRYLKRFLFYNCRDDRSDVITSKILNHFKFLEHLMVYKIFESDDNLSLSLPNLRILDISDVNFKLLIDAPCLYALSARYCLQNLKFSNTKTINYLEVHRADKEFIVFENVTHLKALNGSFLYWYLLSCLPNLQILDISQIELFPPEAKYEKLKNTMNYLLRQKKALKMDKLKIYFDNQLLDDVNGFENYRSFKQIFGI